MNLRSSLVRPGTLGKLRVMLAGGFAIFAFASLPAQISPSVAYTFDTPPGFANFGSADGLGQAALLNSPMGVAADGSGNLFVADTGNHTIRKISPAGKVTTLAGKAGSAGSIDGIGSVARFASLKSVAVDASGNVYVADTGNHTIRKINVGGEVTTFAGLSGNSGSTDGTGSAARFQSPGGIAVDGAGTVYIADSNNHTIRKISPSGDVSTLAGLAGVSGSTDGSGGAARFYFPRDLAVDFAGNVYIADTRNASVRKISSAGEVTTLAVGIDAQGITVDAAGNVVVANTAGNTIQQISATGVVTTLAGTRWGLAGAPLHDGTGTTALFWGPTGLATDGAGNFFVADTYNCAIRKISVGAVVTTLAGAGPHYFRPNGVAVDGAGNVYVADYRDAGYGIYSYYVQGIFKISPQGAVTKVSEINPWCIAVDHVGNVFFQLDYTIQMLSPSGVTTTLAGYPGNFGSSDGVGASARFYYANGLAVDGPGNVYVAESHTVRKVTPAGVVTTLAGDPNSTDAVDGVGSAAHFAGLVAIAADNSGNVYVLDNYKTVRRITPAGVVTTLAGGAETGSGQVLADGQGTAAGFFVPRGLAADAQGNVYVADTSHQTIRKISPSGDVVTIAGIPGHGAFSDGTGTDALFFYPWGIAVDSGTLYVADSVNNAIRRGSPPATPRFVTQPANQTFGIGYSVTLVATTDGPAATYQWLKEGVPIAGATSNFYVIPSATASDAGSYTLVASYATGATASQAGFLTIVPVVAASGHAADFNGDGKADLLWSDSITGEVSVWLMNGTSYLGNSTLGNFLHEWTVAGTGDFNGDGKTDIVWSDSVTGERALWLMNGTNLLGISTLGTFPLEWTVAAVGDFNGDGKPDIVWSNSITGERALWLMDGTTRIGVSTLGIFPLEWTVAATGDFNGDGKPDIVWSNSLTGERALWLMDGTTRIGVSTLGIFPLEWTVVGAADFNGDGKPDIIWSNSVTGERAIWLMDGTNLLAASTLGLFPLEWTARN